VQKPVADRHSSMSYERGCQGQTPPSQERGGFFLHSEIASPCSLSLSSRSCQTVFLVLHVVQTSGASCASGGRDLRSHQDIESTLAVLSTMVLSETWKPTALFGRTRGPRVKSGPRHCRANIDVETHPRPCVSAGNRLGSRR
jgi:hypothetical protein